MIKHISPKLQFIICKIAGFGLLFAFWVKSGETTAFFLLLFLVVMSLLRWRVPKLGITVVVDFIVCTVLYVAGLMPCLVIAVSLFEAMYLGFYHASISILYAFYKFEPLYTAVFALCLMCGYFLCSWERERKQKQLLRDKEAGKYYELESLQSDLVAALAQIEQMTTVSERARIARDIHDNAGHEIVAAYMTFQTIQNMLDSNDNELIELYNTALKRLDIGTNKIREAVHNLSTVTFLGVDRLREKCNGFSAAELDFKVYGDTTKVPIYVWSMLESCLSETLTNIARHSSATWVKAELDATSHIVRLCVTNDGVADSVMLHGNGLRNLRHRAAAIGGSLSIDAGNIFSVVCVIPIRENKSDTGGL